MQTIIPVELPAEICPRRRKNQATGEWEPVLKNWALQPAITGKNPSFWRADGEPQLISHARPVSAEVLLERIAIAERLGKEIGLAVIPGGDLTSVDFDTKHYGSVQELEQDWMALVDRYPVLTGTRMERSPQRRGARLCAGHGSDGQLASTWRWPALQLHDRAGRSASR